MLLERLALTKLSGGTGRERLEATRSRLLAEGGKGARRFCSKCIVRLRHGAELANSIGRAERCRLSLLRCLEAWRGARLEWSHTALKLVELRLSCPACLTKLASRLLLESILLSSTESLGAKLHGRGGVSLCELWRLEWFLLLRGETGATTKARHERRTLVDALTYARLRCCLLRPESGAGPSQVERIGSGRLSSEWIT